MGVFHLQQPYVRQSSVPCPGQKTSTSGHLLQPLTLGQRPDTNGRCSGGQAVQPADKGGRVNLQDRGDQHDIEHREVALAALYRADICAMQSTPMGKIFLRPPDCGARGSDALSDITQ